MPTAKDAGKCTLALPGCNAITVERADFGEQLEASATLGKSILAEALRCVTHKYIRETEGWWG